MCEFPVIWSNFGKFDFFDYGSELDIKDKFLNALQIKNHLRPITNFRKNLYANIKTVLPRFRLITVKTERKNIISKYIRRYIRSVQNLKDFQNVNLLNIKLLVVRFLWQVLPTWHQWSVFECLKFFADVAKNYCCL